MRAKNNLISLLLPVLLIAALVAGISLVRQSTELRKGAYFAQTNILLTPDSLSGRVGDDMTVGLYVETGAISGGSGLAKVDFVKTRICYARELEISPGKITINSEAFDAAVLAKIEDLGESGGCLNLAIKAEREAERLKSGMVKVATLKFLAVRAGEGKVDVDAGKSQVSGFNPKDGAKDFSLKIGMVRGANYAISGEGSKTGPVLNYRITFKGLVSDAKCVNKQVTIMAMRDLTTKEYSDTPERDSSAPNSFVYKGSIRLAGFGYKENVAIFIKGAKHLQMKYGANNQTMPYGKAGGAVALTGDHKTSPVYNWLAYPILAGDVTGENGVPDDWVNGLDFSYVKAKALVHDTVDPGEDLDADLDGNCQVNSNDVQVLKNTINTKQSELY